MLDGFSINMCYRNDTMDARFACPAARVSDVLVLGRTIKQHGTFAIGMIPWMLVFGAEYERGRRAVRAE